VVNFLIQAAGPAAIQFCADWIRNRPPGTQGGGEPGHDEDGCPGCQLHADLAESERLLAAMVAKADQGRVPSHIAATIDLVEQRLRLSMDRIAVIAVERPDLADRAQALRESVQQAHAALPARGAIDLQAAQVTHVAVERCWRQAIDLVGAYFEPRPLSQRDKVLEWVASLPEAERRSFAAAIPP
jgi:hypothetical protein